MAAVLSSEMVVTLAPFSGRGPGIVHEDRCKYIQVMFV